MLNTNDPTAMVMAQQLIEAAQYQQTQNHSAAAAAAAGLYASRAHHQPIHHQQAPPQPAAAYFINPFVSNPQTAAATLLPFETTNGTNNAAAAVASNGYHHHNHHHLQTTTAPANPFNAAAMAAAAAQYAVGVPTLQFLAAAAAAGTPGPFNSGATRADRLEVCQQYLRGTCPNDDSKCALAHPPLTCPIDRSNGQVTVCVDFVKQKCHREVCKYFHPPTHLVEQLRTGSGPANVPATPNAAVAAAALLNARRFMPPYAVAANPFVQHPYTHNHHQLLTSAANQLFRQQLPPANYQIDEKAPSSHHTNDTETSSNSSSTNSSGSSGKKRNYNESIREGDQSAANANDHHSFITSTPNSQCTPPKRPVIDSRLLAGEQTTTMTNQIVSGRGGDRATVPSALMHQQGFFAGQNIHQLQLLHNLQLAYQQQQQNSIGFQQLASSQNPFMQTQLINMPYASLGGGGGGHPQFCYQLQPAMHPGQFVPQQQQQQLPQHHLHNAQQQQQIAAAPASAMAGQLHNAAAIPAAAAAATTGPAGVLYN